MAGLVMYWFRLPAEERPHLRRAHAAYNYVTVFTILNRHRIGMDYLQLCCDIPDVVEAVGTYLQKHPHDE